MKRIYGTFFVLGILVFGSKANASLADAKPSAHWEKDDLVFRWEVNGAPVLLDFVGVFDFRTNRFVDGCEFTGPIEVVSENDREYRVGKDGVEMRCKVANKDSAHLVLNYMLAKYVNISLYYPGDFEKIKGIDPKNIPAEDWLLSTMMDFSFYRPDEYNDYYSIKYNPQGYDIKFEESGEDANDLFEALKPELSGPWHETIYDLQILSVLNHQKAQLLMYLKNMDYSHNTRATMDSLLASFLGCNYASSTFIDDHSDTFFESYLSVERALLPYLYGPNESEIREDIDTWAASWLAIQNGLPDTVASALAGVLLKGWLGDDLKHIQALSDMSEYEKWKNYLASLDLQHPYIGCEIPSFYLKKPSAEFLQKIGAK